MVELKTSKNKVERDIYAKYEHLLLRAYQLLDESIDHPLVYEQLRMVTEASIILTVVRQELPEDK